MKSIKFIPIYLFQLTMFDMTEERQFSTQKKKNHKIYPNLFISIML
jgi:hypothetical protein